MIVEKTGFVAGASDENERVDRAVSRRFGFVSRSTAQKMADSGHLFVNGAPVSKNALLRAGDRVELLPLVEPKKSCLKPEPIPLEILYEDDCLLVVNKPQGMAVYPGPGNPSGTLANALLYHCGGELSRVDPARPGIVHRLDRLTSGLLVCAKTDEAHLLLARQLEERSMLRRYEGVTHGCPKENSGVVDAPIARHPAHRTRMCVPAAGGRRAVTRYEVLARYRGFAHCSFRLETGRTHQIRVHMAHIGHPLAGDAVYAPGLPGMGLAGQCLHAAELGFIHPVSGKPLNFTADLPACFREFLLILEKTT